MVLSAETGEIKRWLHRDESEIARLASLTVSIAALIMGMLSGMFLVSRVRVSTCEGRISDFAGTRSTSSNVRASPLIRPVIRFPHLACGPVSGTKLTGITFTVSVFPMNFLTRYRC